MLKLDKEESYIEALKAPNIHHVIAAFGDHTHHLHSFLQHNMRVKRINNIFVTIITLKQIWAATLHYLQLGRIHSSLLGNFVKIL